MTKNLNYLNKIKNKITYQKVLLQNYLFYRQNMTTLPIRGHADLLLIGTPCYGNLGDQLIAFAELKFLRDFYPSKKIIEISENDIRYRLRTVERLVDDDTLIFLQGGGNISDIWVDQEKIRKQVINKFSGKKMIVMPQTIYLSDASMAPEILKKYAGVTVCAREENTYQILLENQINAHICPDIALYLVPYCEKYRSDHIRKGIGVCLRKDEEALFYSSEQEIFHYLNTAGMEGQSFSTVIDKFVSIDDREKEIEIILKYISTKELIITDRLHAMIMAYLTNTPCIAYANANKKVEGTYQWIKNADNIYFTSDVSDGLQHIQNLIKKNNRSGFEHMDKYKKITELV